MTVSQAIQSAVGQLPAEQQREVLDFALFLSSRSDPLAQLSDAERQAKLRMALEQAAKLDPFRDIDPLGWQREQRLARSPS